MIGGHPTTRELDRLTDMRRGLLDDPPTSLSTTTFRQNWGLDQVGNWETFDQGDDGAGTSGGKVWWGD